MSTRNAYKGCTPGSSASPAEQQRESLQHLPVIATGARFAYYGDREGWCIAATVHRDSGALERSNWYTLTVDILGMPESSANEDGLADAAIERMRHFLVGWIEYLLVRPGTPQAACAIKWRKKLDIYPIADEVHFGVLEWNEEWCVRCHGATRADHYSSNASDCGKFRSKDDADNIHRRWRMCGRVERSHD